MATTVSIRKGDEVQVIAGKDKGRRGRVVNVHPKDNRVMVEGMARATKHSRPTKRVTQGGIIQQEMFIDLSNVLIVCRACGRAARVGHRIEAGVKARVCKRCGAET
jgi:large subunit ribosomal protein L24